MSEYPRMRRYWKKKWIAALRSGKYKQGKYHLYKDGLWCALGVFCDVSKNSKHMEWNIREEENTGYCYHYQQGVPVEPLKYFGLYASREFITDMNDNAILQHTFPEIANWIEENI